MTPKKFWTDEYISAYLDAQLAPQEQAAFTRTLEQDPELRARVESTRMAVRLMHSLPARPAPRNFLLTPAMVAEKPAPPARPPRSLLWMRVATALSGVACAITLAVNMLPVAPAPVADMAMQYSVMTTAVESVPADGDVVATGVASEGAIDIALAPLPESGGAAPNGAGMGSGALDTPPGDSMRGLGGSEAPAFESAAATATPEPATFAMMVTEEPLSTPLPMLEPEISPKMATSATAPIPQSPVAGAASGAYISATIQEMALSGIAEGDVASTATLPAATTSSTRLPPWLPIALGFSTLILGAITVWFSRR